MSATYASLRPSTFRSAARFEHCNVIQDIHAGAYMLTCRVQPEREHRLPVLAVHVHGDGGTVRVSQLHFPRGRLAPRQVLPHCRHMGARPVMQAAAPWITLELGRVSVPRKSDLHICLSDHDCNTHKHGVVFSSLQLRRLAPAWMQ